METMLTSIISAGIAVAVWTVLLPVLQKWIGVRIEQPVKHGYDVRMENIRQDAVARNRAALVADLIAEWLSHPKDTTKLNRLTFEAFLYLPQGIAEDLGKCLALRADAPDVRTLIGEVRKHLLGADDEFNPQQINIFPSSCAHGSRTANSASDSSTTSEMSP